MAIAYRTSAVDGNTTTGTSPTATITPVAGDLFLVFCQATGNTNATPTCSDGNTGGAYTLLFAEGSNTNGNYLSCFVRNNLLANTTSTTVTVACGAHSAAEICVVAVSGAPVAGAAAIVQYGVQANQAASTTPAPALNPLISVDVILSAVGNATNPAGVAVPSNTQIWTWTRPQNAGQTGCGLGVSYSTGAIGALPGGAVTWGSTSASVFASCAVEIGAGAANAGVNVSKLVGYGVMAPPAGVDVSKLVGYGVLAPPAGVDVSKLVGYGVLAPPVGIAVSKLVAYAVLSAINTNPPVWPTISPPIGYVGNAYSLTWGLSPAAPPTTYTLYSGSLPPGLSLNSISADLGSITGTPTTAGSYSFVVTATNAYGKANQPMTITINNPVGGGGAFVWAG
jgi:hypothetical protein